MSVDVQVLGRLDDDAIRVRRREASEKRQGTKSRDVERGRCHVRYGDLTKSTLLVRVLGGVRLRGAGCAGSAQDRVPRLQCPRRHDVADFPVIRSDVVGRVIPSLAKTSERKERGGDVCGGIHS
jgi:hypothetical protein